LENTSAREVLLSARQAIIAALEREVAPLIKNWTRIRRDHSGHTHTFFEHGDTVLVCGGIGSNAARRAAEAAIALYHPTLLHSVGFAGALESALRVGDLFSPSLVLDARDGSRTPLSGPNGTLLTFMEVAGAAQKLKLAQSYSARAIDMEAAAIATSAAAHGLSFAVTKVISDEVHFEMPDLSAFIDSNGQFKTMNYALYAAIRPRLWRRLISLGRNSNRAAQALSTYLESYSPESVVAALPAGDRQ
jgi:adenosylhomocysteine nucleosidase